MLHVVSPTPAEVSSSVMLIVPITITQRPDHLTVEVEEGDVVDLTVLASGDPLYELVEQWEIVNSTHSRYFTDGTVPPFVERQEDRQSVYRYFIDTANMTSAQLKAIEGTYIRHFANRIVDTSVSIKVTLAPLPGEGCRATCFCEFVTAMSSMLWFCVISLGLSWPFDFFFFLHRCC